jgi:hypothetical protein
MNDVIFDAQPLPLPPCWCNPSHPPATHLVDTAPICGDCAEGIARAYPLPAGWTPEPKTPAPPPALTPSLPPDPPPESKSETSQPTQSDGGAGASLPSGWRQCLECGDDLQCVVHESNSETNIICTQIKRGANGFFWENNRSSGSAPSRLQAMCAALSIELLDSPNTESGGWTRVWLCSLVTDSFGEFVRFYDADACAREALERYHAQQAKPVAACRYCRGPLGECACHDPDVAFHANAMLRVQQSSPKTEKPPPTAQETGSCSASDKSAEPVAIGVHSAATSDCKFWWPNSGKRQATRWCSLHAAEWQTFAEQSAGELDPRERGARVRSLLGSWRAEDEALGTHPDGTPRAGCDVCEGGKRS